MQAIVGNVGDMTSLEDARRAFFDCLDRHEERIEVTKRKVESIYRFETPAAPYVEFTIADDEACRYVRSRWTRSESDERIDRAMQAIWTRLELLPQFDYVPAASPGWGTSDLIPRMFGCEFDRTAEGGVINRSYAISNLEADVDRLPEIDVSKDSNVGRIADTTEALVEAFDGRVQVVYPQMQGPLTNAVRVMEQRELLIACCTHPELVRSLVAKVWRPAIEVVKLLQARVGEPGLLRPRARFWQPKSVMGLIVDDYLSVIRPEHYLAICGEMWRQTAANLGDIYFHTCGPVAQASEALAVLPGLTAFETAFVHGQHTRIRDVRAMKEQLAGRLVFGTFGLPFGEPVEDDENLTPEMLKLLTRGGGYMMHASGTIESGQTLSRRLGLNYSF